LLNFWGSLLLACKTEGLPKQGILIHRLHKMLKVLQEDFPPDKKTLEELRQARAQFETETARNEHLLAVYRITERENERLWSDDRPMRRFIFTQTPTPTHPNHESMRRMSRLPFIRFSPATEK
jgi:hypothetical protein